MRWTRDGERWYAGDEEAEWWLEDLWYGGGCNGVERWEVGGSRGYWVPPMGGYVWVRVRKEDGR
jgi:hypothetical protein